MSDQGQRSGEARALALAVNALGEAVPFAVEARRSAMAMGDLDEATPVLGTSPHLRKQIAGLAAIVEDCRTRAVDIFSKAPIPVCNLSDTWRRLLSDAPQLTPPDVLQRLLELYWACLSRLTRLVVDATTSSDAEASNLH